jgi:hypothetical protein
MYVTAERCFGTRNEFRGRLQNETGRRLVHSENIIVYEALGSFSGK